MFSAAPSIALPYGEIKLPHERSSYGHKRQWASSPCTASSNKFRIGANEICICGSGKKYKKCCRLKNNLK